MNDHPWYYERGQGNYFNRWSLVHAGFGVAGQLIYGNPWLPLAMHTFYELAESRVYPYEGRDRSWQNHVGDTAAFLTAALVTAQLMQR